VIRHGCLPIAALALIALTQGSAQAAICDLRNCDDTPQVETQPGQLVATYFEVRGETGYAGQGNSGEPLSYRWRLRTQCELSDAQVGGCNRGEIVCEAIPDRIIIYYIVQQQRLVRADGQPVDGQTPPAGLAPGTPYGGYAEVFAGCVDVTDLNPPPSPDEVFRYFQTLPLPQLTTRQQPPGQALVGLPVIFFTDSPTTRTFTVDIRGFTVDIAATASSYTWDTGDGAVLTTTEPGAPYPNQTITHDYSSGTYTASLTTTWGATFSVDGALAAQVPGTTTTQGPPVTFTVRQARTVLTNPYD
jgi:hypothetical protein